MAFYFFADINNLNNQIDLAFGPADNATINNVEYERFLVTSKHTAVTDINAIAVCRGQILVQAQSANASLLNIVFKPIDTQPFNFPKIKYFIYKGIRKNSLLAENDIDLAAENTNDLLDSIWSSFRKVNSTGIPSKSILGLQTDIEALLNSTPLEEVFSSEYTDVQFWNVKAGSILGKFDKDSIGFEIVLDTLFYKPTLELARNSETFIRVKSLAASPLHKDFFEHWHDKESVINFIDPCAFFGSFYDDKLSVLADSSKSRWKGEELYTNLITKFLNKNKCYIDIRNEFNFSLNYFKNYGASPSDNSTVIKVKKGSTASVASGDYYGSDWPLLILDNTGFSASNTEHQVLTLQLPAGNGDNPAPIIYFSKAFMPGGKFSDEYTKTERFKPLTVTNNFCQEFSIGLPWVNGDLISSYVQLKYCKQATDDVLPAPITTQIRRVDYLDALFAIQMDFDFANSNVKSKTFNDVVYGDLRATHSYDAVFSLVLSFSTENVMFTANPIDFHHRERQRVTLEKSDDYKLINENQSYLQEKSDEVKGSTLTRKVLNLSETEFEVLHFEPAFVDMEERINVPDFTEIVALNLTRDQWTDVIDLATASNYVLNYPIYLTVANKVNQQDDNEIYYTSFDLALEGFKISGSDLITYQTLTGLNFTTYGIV